MVVGKRRFLIILIAVLCIFTSFIILVPTPVAKKLRISELPVVSQFRNKFNIDRNTEIILVGDIMLGRSVMTTSLDKNDPNYPFLKVADVLRSADLTVANLENPIIQNCPRKTSGLIFCTDPSLAMGLVYAGVDVVNLANNHTGNYGNAGIEETKGILDQKGIVWVDGSVLKIVEKGGIKFGLLGFERSQLANPELLSVEEQLIQESDKLVDVLIISIHWGVEYQDTALPGVQKLASRLVELGADVIHGHHPHWVQNIQYIKDPISLHTVPIYYSLGNFVFDQMWSEKTKQGLMIKLTLDESGKFVKDEKVDVYIENVGQPSWLK